MSDYLEIEDQPAEEEVVAAEPADDDLGIRLKDWAQSLPSWQQDLVARLLAAESLTEDEQLDAISRVLADCGYENGRDNAAPILIEDTAFSAYQSSSSGSIKSIGNLKSVNGLVSDGVDPLAIAEGGVTLIYGPNAAGKTGYARTLKYVGRSVTGRPRILPNVRQGETGDAPSATIEMLLDGEERPFEVDFTEQPPQDCSVIRAFDAGAADVYVADETAVDFTPPVLSVFGRLATEQKALAASVKERIAELEAVKPELDLEGGDDAHEAVEAIGPGTDIDGLITKFATEDGDAARLEELRKSASAIGPALTAQIRVERGRAQRAQTILQSLEQINGTLSDAAIDRRDELASAAAQKSALAKSVIEETFDENERSPDAISLWRSMWDASEAFFEEIHGHAKEFPPSQGEPCPLCAQDLGSDASSRFARFNGFISERTAVEAATAKAASEEAKAQLAAPGSTPDAEHLAELRELDPDAGVLIDAYLAAVEPRREFLVESDTKTGAPPLPDLPKDEVEAFVVARTAKAEQLDGLNDDDKRQQLLGEVGELAGRLEISGHEKELRAWWDVQPELVALRKAVQALDTRDITNRHGEFAKQVITKDFLEQLRDELNVIGLGYLAVDVTDRGEAGGRKIQISMQDFQVRAALPDVLSEGERRGLGLACFFAELATFGGSGPMVLDDPVSSFDYERRDHVTRRLLHEAEKRQVVVFTHDVSFAVTMNRIAKMLKRKVEFRSVRRIEGQPGYVLNDKPDEMRSTTKRAKELAAELDVFPDPADLQPGEHARIVRRWYAELRLLWERVVEQDLLNGVAIRFDHAVHTVRFNGLLIERDDELAVEKGFSRASDRDHEPPEGVAVPVSTIEEMRQDLKDLTDLVQTVKQRRKDKGFTD